MLCIAVPPRNTGDACWSISSSPIATRLNPSILCLFCSKGYWGPELKLSLILNVCLCVVIYLEQHFCGTVPSSWSLKQSGALSCHASALLRWPTPALRALGGSRVQNHGAQRESDSPILWLCYLPPKISLVFTTPRTRQ